MAEKINVYRIFVGRSKWRRPLAKRRRRWEDKIEVGT
jgi:hypothetical protein